LPKCFVNDFFSKIKTEAKSQDEYGLRDETCSL